MEGSASYAQGYLKTDLRNTRTLLGLLESEAGASRDAWLAEVERLVHDLSVGLRESGTDPASLDLAALLRQVEETAHAAARERAIADDTVRQWARSFARVLPWWQALPPAETLLDLARWSAPGARVDADDVATVVVTADERFRLTRVHRTQAAVADHFEKHLSKRFGVRRVRFVDADGEVVAQLALLDDGPRWT